jgi:hypothetical protein
MAADPPDPPDPKETSAAQTGTSVATAIANAWLGNTNRVGPDGTTTWNQSGMTSMHDPFTGETYQVPRFTETVTLSPEQQAIYDKTNAAKGSMADLAAQQSSFLKDYMAKPIDLSNEATEARLWELGSSRLDPRFARDEQALKTSLLNRGIREGSEAWTAAMGDMGQAKNDAYNQLLLSGRSQATQEAMAERNQPINEITALLSGSQVGVPQFSNNQQPTIPTTDNAGLINQNYQQQMANWQQKNAGTQGILGGMFGLGSALLMPSDERVKEDVRAVGETDDGQTVYQFRYKGSPLMQMGLMAQEVEKKKPGAVQEIGGVKHVDYRKALAGA